MFIKFSAVVITALVLTSCGGGTEKNATSDTSKTAGMPMHMDSTESKKEMFTNVQFALTKDPACNMPLSAGIEDTTHYKDKVYGFCSKECKDEFLKDPESFLAKK